ncbi:MAG TPA: tRNA epoxyqueuosine(34) reductase QueG [Pyrinomonadaceae bacterium]|nr:tRNA epoxyqueuosine(34) reductase QueG [Pyrinomonadaceae bacterium]
MAEEGARPSPTAEDSARISRARLTEEVKSRALALGFQKVGVVRAEALTEERARLEEWLARGRHAGMSWMARDVERRTDPRELLPGARSVVVVALNYFTPHEHAGGQGTGKISRYAWGDDYHDVLGERLRSLLEQVDELAPGVRGKVCVDAQPAMDKAWAVRAGLGWIGKHSNLITREYGSWVFLGELILDAELEYDAARVEDHCGTCTLCIEACPTAAIVEPYVVDSALCVSHATIELRDAELPPAVAPNLEGWLYGCDTCQDVCPWNRFEQPSAEPRFEPRPGNVSPPLEEIADLTHDAYVERFRRSPLKRAKLTGLQRNARALLSLPREESDDPL